MNKNEKLLESFTAYCIANPEQRFWQALRNWSGGNFIYVSVYSKESIYTPELLSNFTNTLKDTFFYEDKTE